MRNFLIKLPRNIKRSLLITIDVLAIGMVYWSSLMIRSGSVFLPSEGYELTKASPEALYFSAIIVILITIPVFILSRLYRSIIRYISLETYVKITKATFISSILASFAMTLVVAPIPRSTFLIYFVLLTLVMFYTRYTARSYLSNHPSYARKNILIFGIDDSSQKVHELLKNSNEFRTRGFLSDNDEDKKTRVSEVPVFMAKDIAKIVETRDIDEIIVLPDDSGSIKPSILSSLHSVRKKLRKIPDLNRIARGTLLADDIKKIEIEDLLGRDAVKPDPYLLKSCITDKSVLITGCGGSIGSELAKQIINLQPKSLILLEQSEYSLYKILQELNDLKRTQSIDVPIISYQGSVCDESLIEYIFTSNTIDTVYHAAANKHVPLVEHNALDAIKTNIFGTYAIANIAYKKSTENFVLISSDKAVRPTNIMGATKRFSEIILQAIQNKINELPKKISKTKFCMVRFGNVLDTSGSVVPLFRKQIKNGGPVTVTDKEVIRYFMTIKEATELVIQAGSLSKGGDVFLLEMGKPVNIYSLARQMIELSGYEVKDNKNMLGDIEIEFTGLREGEKLYEELLIGDNVQKTAHTSIMSAKEDALSFDQVAQYIEKFRDLSPSSSSKEIRLLLLESIGSDYSPKSNVIDINKV